MQPIRFLCITCLHQRSLLAYKTTYFLLSTRIFFSTLVTSFRALLSQPYFLPAFVNISYSKHPFPFIQNHISFTRFVRFIIHSEGNLLLASQVATSWTFLLCSDSHLADYILIKIRSWSVSRTLRRMFKLVQLKLITRWESTSS